MAAQFCPRCGTARTGDLRFCASCAYDFASAVPATAPAAPTNSWLPPQPVGMVAVTEKGRTPVTTMFGRSLAFFFAVIFGLWLLGTFVKLPGPSPAAPGADSGWAPSGFTVSRDNSDLAWRWMDKGEYSCTISTFRCVGVMVVARNGCATSLYAEVTVLNAAGDSVGFSNDVTGSISAGQKAKLVLDIIEKEGAKTSSPKLTCF